MTTLEDKILGEKRHNYCSSSDSDDENENEVNRETNSEYCSSEETVLLGQNKSDIPNGLHNTGPKGVIDDKQYFEYLKQADRKKNNKESYELIKKLSLTCSSAPDDRTNKLESDDNDPSSENFMVQYRKKRMLEMLAQTMSKRKFGKLMNLSNSDAFLKAVDKEDKTTLVIIHIYDNVSICKKINKMLIVLAKEYKNVKFCKILSTVAGLSLNFKISGIPAFLVYKDKQLVGNFIRITDDLGDEICESDIENFFIEHGILLDQSCMLNNTKLQ